MRVRVRARLFRARARGARQVEFSVDEVEKYFELGDHVKVVSGRKAGVTGTVVAVEGEVIGVLTGP